jgi:hypothetical protein
MVDRGKLWSLPLVFAVAAPSSCGDDSAPDGGAGTGSSEAGTSSDGTDATPPGPSRVDTSDSGAPAGGFGEFCIDEESLAGPACGPVSWSVPLGFDLRPGTGWPEEQVDLAPCTVFAIAQGAGMDVGLSCDLEGSPFPRTFAIRVWAPAGTAMPWRMGQRVELSAFVRWPPPSFSLNDGRFVVRDPETHEILVGGGSGTLYQPDGMFAPFAFERRLDVCGQERLSGDGDSCSFPLYEAPYGISITAQGEGDEPTILMDAGTTVIEGTKFFAHAAQMTWSCICADVPRWSELLLMGTAFTKTDAIDPPDCELLGTDCGPGEQCLPVRADAGAWDRTACVGTGPVGEGEPCSADGDCVAGTRCVPSSSGEATCRSACAGTIDALTCPAGQWCSLDTEGEVPPVTCMPDCDPLGDDCPSGEGCYLDYDVLGFRCAALDEQPGPAEACSAQGCAPGSMCIWYSGIPSEVCDEYCCVALCDLDEPMCPVDLACQATDGFADPTLGLCLPPPP